MKNKEIRTQALNKRNGKTGLFPVAFAWVGLTVASQYVTQWTQSLGFWAGMVLYALFLVVQGFTMVSCAYAGCAAWKIGRASSSDLCAPVLDTRRFVRTMGLVLTVGLLTLVQRYGFILVEEGEMAANYVRLFASLALSVLAALVYELYYALVLWPNAALTEVFGAGLKLAFRAFWRTLGMNLRILFFPLLGVVILQRAWTHIAKAQAPNIISLIALGIALAGSLAYIAWRVIPYYLIAQAGLAMEIFGENHERGKAK